MRYALLCCLLAACSLPDPRVAGVPDLPPIPTYLDGATSRIAVVWVDSIPSPDPGFIVLGRYSPLDGVVYLWKGVKHRGEQWRVLLHEECHVRHWDRGVRFFDETVEKMCDVYAYRMLATLPRR